MSLYQLRFFSRQGTLVGSGYPFQANDDVDAINFAAVWTEDAPMELWRGKTRLKRWDAELPRDK
jgi:hypothetical protein